jgi:5-methylcytosine-specific restriction endonuclease McrA
VTAHRNERKNYAGRSSRRASFAQELEREGIKRDRACVQCGSTFLLSAHHIVPRVEGGPDELENLEALCVACHGRAEAKRRAGNG